MKIDSIKISDIVSMWGTNDERIGILVRNGKVYFAVEVKILHEFLIGEFY